MCIIRKNPLRLILLREVFGDMNFRLPSVPLLFIGNSKQKEASRSESHIFEELEEYVEFQVLNVTFQRSGTKLGEAFGRKVSTCKVVKDPAIDGRRVVQCIHSTGCKCLFVSRVHSSFYLFFIKCGVISWIVQYKSACQADLLLLGACS